MRLHIRSACTHVRIHPAESFTHTVNMYYFLHEVCSYTLVVCIRKYAGKNSCKNLNKCLLS